MTCFALLLACIATWVARDEGVLVADGAWRAAHPLPRGWSGAGAAVVGRPGATPLPSGPRH